MAKNSGVGSLILRAASSALAKTALTVDRRAAQIVRTNGYFEGFPGDIVDQGYLAGSKSVKLSGPYRRIISYGDNSAPYALFVHEGYTLRNGREQPGRPWITEAIRDVDLPTTFAQFFEEKLNELG